MKRYLYPANIIIAILAIVLASCDITIPSSSNNPTGIPTSDTSSGSQGGSNNSNQGGTGAGTGCYNPVWDKAFAPHYVIHATGHGTTSGGVKDDWWFLFGVAPTNNSVTLPDGSGGTFTYSTDYSSGPFSSPREVCNAEGGKLGDNTMKAWNSWDSWNCKELLACNERADTANRPQGQGDNTQPGGNNPGGVGIANPGGGNPGDAQPGVLTAWLNCGDFLDLEAGPVSEPCDVCVSGWTSNTATRVTVTFPSLGNIAVAPGNTSADPGGMFNTGPTDHPEYCFGELLRTDDGTPRQVLIPIQVQQGNGPLVNLSLTVNVPESYDPYPFRICPAGRTITVAAPIFNAGRDWVDNYGVNPDTVPDTFIGVTITSSDPAALITYLRLELADRNGNPLGALYPIWDTMPNSYRFMAVFFPATNQWLNLPDGSITSAVTGGSVTYTLAVNDPEGYLANPNMRLLATVEFGNNATCTASGLGP